MTFSTSDFWYNTDMLSCLMLAALLTNCADVANHVFARQTGDRFDLTGRVLVRDNNNDPILNLTDATGGTRVMGVRHVAMPLPFKSGDTVRVTGIINVPPDKRTDLPCAICQSASFIASGNPPPPVAVSASDLVSSRYDCRLVRISGRIRQVVRDEIDARCIYVQLLVDSSIVYITANGDASLLARLRSLIDAEVEAVGFCQPSSYMRRRFIGYTISIASMKDVTVLTPAPSDPYDAQPLDVNMVADASTINRLGRRRIVGTVLAPCANGLVILQTDKGEILDVHLLDGDIPPCGSRIEAVGIPETDFYQINLVDAIWRDAPGEARQADMPQNVTIERLLTTSDGHEQIDPSFHGKVIRTSGTVIDMPTRESGRDFAILKDKGRTILLDISSARQTLDSVQIGCEVEVVGVCVVNRDPSATSQAHFQRVNGITLVVRDSKDVAVVSRPPWWTPLRLTVLVAILLLVLVLIFIWNRLLQRVIDRKSRQLLREHTAHIKAALRAEERTNLAVELHDSLSQNLSGVACQIAATKGTLPDGAEETARHLSTAERMLFSCRTELRRCLWDLRENALSEANFADAVRKTLDPVVVGADVKVDFDLPRTRLDETTAHAILCIIRELASNAVRHGKAKNIKVSGELRERAILFSVADDGCGFVPGDAAGADEGHFGLDGIRERIKRLDGSFSIVSEPGKGCMATATIPLKS